MNRLDDLETAATIYELVVKKPVELDGDLKGQLSLELADGVNLAFDANHNDVPLDKHGSVNWKQVTRIKIMNIGRLK